MAPSNCDSIRMRFMDIPYGNGCPLWHLWQGPAILRTMGGSWAMAPNGSTNGTFLANALSGIKIKSKIIIKNASSPESVGEFRFG